MEESKECEIDLIKNVMSSMGWSNTFTPIANEENKRLMDSIRFLGSTRLERNHAFEDQKKKTSRFNALLTAANNEFDQNLKLLTAHKSQYSTEYHLIKLSEYDVSFYMQTSKESEKSEKQLFQQHKNESEKINSSIDKLTEGVQWAKSALTEWCKVMLSGDGTRKIIEKLCRMDAGRAESLDSKRKIINEIIVKQQTVLVNAYEEKKALEFLLERTSQLYHQAHHERRQLVNTWKDAVNQMNQREKEINETEIEIDNARQITDQKRSILKHEEMIMKLKQDENHNTELLIKDLNVTTADLRSRFFKLEESIGLKNSEFLVFRKSVQIDSLKLNNLRNENRQILAQEKDKKKLLNSMVFEMKSIREKYDKFKDNNSNAQECLRQIEEMLDMEKKNIRMIQDETNRLSSTHYRSEQQLKKLQKSEANLMLESKVLEAGIKKTQTACKKLEKELVRQTEILYSMDSKIQKAEIRLATMKGNVDDENLIKLEHHRVYLEKKYKDKIETDELMKAQVSRVEEDLKKLSSIYQNSFAEYKRNEQRLKERKRTVDGGEKQQKILNQQNQEKLVEQNLLKIRITQMEKQISKQTEKAFSLEKHKMELEAAMNDRLIDMKSQMNWLNMRKKCLIEERGQMKIEIGERLLKIGKLKKRFEISLDLIGKNDDGTNKTTVQIKVQMAQEKYLLINEGNELNEKIVNAENEINCLDNTLKLMNFSNDEYRKVFETITESSPEVKKMNELYSQYWETMNDIKTLKGNLVNLIDHIELLESQNQELETEFEEVQKTKLDNNDILLKLHKELTDQETKLERSDRDMKTAFKTAKRRIKDQEFVSFYEKNLAIKECEDRNNSCLQQLAALVDIITDMSQKLTRHFLERGLSVPMNMQRAKSQSSWKSEMSIGDQSLKDNMKYSHCSFVSGYSASLSSSSKASTRESVKETNYSSGLSVVKITFPDISPIKGPQKH
ncbi:CLUMA_CG012751, isoform A [Clunio marinus]|uniref:Coiled-coil domain-containing protein 39 n=1 Tax=Clunio marinus TaxID=568069 RepID=A0A1J1IHZ5_9DIPT|nr:CLUMA_CG012751, isoform A [Clunio marinus]